MATDLAQWSSSSACDGAALPEGTPDAPVAYVAVGVDVMGSPSVHDFTATSAADRETHVTEIEQQGYEVVSVGVDEPVEALAIDDPVFLGPPASPYGPQWGVAKVGFEAAWATAGQGAGVRVAVIDTGVQANHADLTGGVVAGRDFVDTGLDGGSDPNSHGTHVAGILGARDNAIGGIGGAPAVTIVPVRVLGANGSGSMANVVNGIMWAASPTGGNADVINLSLGSGSCSEPLFDALSYAVSQGATVVAAAGNCGCTTQRLYPAAFAPQLAGTIAVASTDPADARSSFSNINDYLTVAAPGGGSTSDTSTWIWSTVPTNPFYGAKRGTSMASPAVAALVALVKAKCPSYTPAQVQNRIVSTALDLGAAGFDTSFGHGRIRADLAVAATC